MLGVIPREIALGCESERQSHHREREVGPSIGTQAVEKYHQRWCDCARANLYARGSCG
jgi:hypothetical protein